MSPGPDERLDSWKEIAAYLKKGVRTVQRWERTEGLPVRRLGQDRTGIVFAYKAELDAWWQDQSNRLSPRTEPDLQPAPGTSRPRWSIRAILLIVSLAVAAVLWKVWPSAPVVYRPVPVTTEHGWQYEPSFSPDGRRIAYVWIPPAGKAFVYTKTIGAESGVRVSSSEQPEVRPAWSPDGRFIALLRSMRPHMGYAVILVSTTGEPEHPTAELNTPGVLAWSSDGQWLVGADGTPKANLLVAISVASGEKHALTKASEFGYQGAALSSDSRRLVFSMAVPGARGLYEQALGPKLSPRGEPRLVVKKLWATEVLVQPDAKEVIYTDGSWEEGFSLWRVGMSDSAKPQLIYATSDRCLTPAMSPDGRRLAFAVARGYREDTWRKSLSDPHAEAAPLLSSTHSDLNPQYAPDGRHIAFHSTRSGASDIWIADSDGTNPRRLTFTNARTTATPRWSPDGEWIAFESNQAGQSEVYVVRSAGGTIRRLTDNTATDAIPSWSRDGHVLYFCSNRTGRFEIWKMPPFGGPPTQVTYNGGFAAVESPDAKYLYYSQTRNFGPVMRIPLSGGTAEQVIPDIRGLFYAVTARGIYFEWNRTISFWDAGSGSIHEVFAPSKPMGIGIDVSPDGQNLLFTQVHTDGADLHMIDGMR